MARSLLTYTHTEREMRTALLDEFPGTLSPVSSKEMREIEEKFVQAGVSRLMMMENAGAELARFVIRILPLLRASQKLDPRQSARVLLIGGTGNNGGDVFVAARHLRFWRPYVKPRPILLGREEDVKAEEARHNMGVLKSIGEEIKPISSIQDLPTLQSDLRDSEIAIVGIFGTGFKGDPRELQRRAIELINDNDNAIVVSVDIPSGLDADSGQFDVAVASDYTVTMARPKLGMIASPEAAKLCGEIVVANIGAVE
jgi:hydroxyethylthiazole kinase-like uncharacterized protein yjeF